MKTQYYTATSINGFIADENNSLDWLFQFEMIESMDAFFNEIGAAAMGSTTYEWVIENESMIENPERWIYKYPIWVFSTRKLAFVEGADIRFVRGDVRPVHAQMAEAAGEKNIWLIGGGDLVGQFHDHDLLDEIILSVAPVMLESGAPLLPRNITNPPMKLIDVQKHGDVFANLTYEMQK